MKLPPYLPNLRESEVVGVPWLLVVGEDVRAVVVAFAHIDETVVQSPPFPCKMPDDATRVPWDITYLSAVAEGVGGVSEAGRCRRG